MKKIFCFLAICITTIQGFSQSAEIARTWTGAVQSVDASFLKKKVKFKVTVSVKAEVGDTTAWAGLGAVIEGKEKGKFEFFGSPIKDRVKTPEWRTVTMEGSIDQTASRLHFGPTVVYNGKFYFDNVELFVENDKGVFQKVAVKNQGFEDVGAKGEIAHWVEGIRDNMPQKVKNYTITSSAEHVQGKRSLLIEGKGIPRDTSNLIGPVKGYTPQIGTLVMMLNNLSDRVNRVVKGLTPEETDFLMDEKANSIGALVMHLAAAEKYYQIYTFEGRDEFNEEEKKQWQAALDLGDAARKQFKGHPISYYLDIYKEVRKKTLEELQKRDDDWLARIFPGSDMNNHFCWFHVMEHQSSHLGQVLLLKKRFPEKEEDKLKTKIDHDH